MTDLRLVLFDVDGTLVDSQASILSAMKVAFGAEHLPCPSRSKVLDIVGLSLDHAMARLSPASDRSQIARLSDGYKAAYHRRRIANGAEIEAPLYPGARAALDRLHGVDNLLLGVATGKSRRGVDALVQAHGLTRHFVTRQVADDHPSKPHPSMILTALAETGIAPHHCVMIGDTTYDMDMARAAGVSAIGVGWGYHPTEQLNADIVIDGFDALDDALGQIWKAKP
jgi:phosphoglycolate phosphatase